MRAIGLIMIFIGAILITKGIYSQQSQQSPQFNYVGVEGGGQQAVMVGA